MLHEYTHIIKEELEVRILNTFSQRMSHTSNIIFNPLLLHERERHPSFPSELTGYHYKNYDISFSIEAHGGYPHRVLSITPHGFSPEPMTESELEGLLEYFSFYSFLPVRNYNITHNGDPYTGDTQYYSQMVMDLQDLKELPAAAGL